MGWDKAWTSVNHPVTDDLVKQVFQVLQEKIEENNGEYKAKIQEIMTLMNIAEDNQDEWYGTIWAAIKVIRDKGLIESRSLGRSGNAYTMNYVGEGQVLTDVKPTNDESQQILDQIRFLVQKYDEKDALQTLRIIKQLLN